MSVLTFIVFGLMLSSLLKPKSSMKTPFPSNCSGWYVILLWLLCEFVTISLGWTLFRCACVNRRPGSFLCGCLPLYIPFPSNNRKRHITLYTQLRIWMIRTPGVVVFSSVSLCTEWSVYAASQPMMKGNTISIRLFLMLSLSWLWRQCLTTKLFPACNPGFCFQNPLSISRCQTMILLLCPKKVEVWENNRHSQSNQ